MPMTRYLTAKSEIQIRDEMMPTIIFVLLTREIEHTVFAFLAIIDL